MLKMSGKLRQKVFGLKMSIGEGAECTPEMLAKINQYALTPLKVEEVYTRKLLLAHNCIDRDNERFPDAMLDQFAETILGKSLLIGHNRKETGSGLFFEASTEEMTIEQFKSITGENPRMPDGLDRCKCLWAWFYTLKTPSSEEWLKWIDGGITRHCSIGFAAADLAAVRKDPNGPALYWEYCCPGEALEGSLVWLGAQPGATSQKNMKDQETKDKGEPTMKMLVSMLVGLGLKSLTETATEEQIAAGIKTLADEKDAKISELEGKAADGEAYRNDLIADTVKFAALLEEIGTDEKAQKEEADFLKTVPIARLKSQRDKYEAKARDKFPTHTIFTGKDQSDREQHGKEGEEKSQETKGKKDFTNPAHNELFKTVGK